MKTASLAAAAVAAACMVLSCGSAGGSGSGSGGGGGVQRSWNFEDPAKGVDRWELTSSEFWQYTGDIALAYDNTVFGNGMLRFDLDFSDPKNQSDWSEPKLKIDLLRAVGLKGMGSFAYDFYFTPTGRNKGSFKTKIFSNNVLDASIDIPDSGEDTGNGFVKVRVIVPFKPTSAFITDMRLSIIGSNTDYAGPVFIDNIEFIPIGQ